MSATDRPQARTSRRRQELLVIAADLFAERGVSGTTIRDIAERAQILSGSLYHHFESKESMVDEIVRGYFEELRERSFQVIEQEQSAEQMLRGLVRVMLGLADERRSAVRIIHRDWDYLVELLPYVSQSMRDVERLWVSVLRRGASEGVFSPKIDLSLAYRSMLGAMSWVTRARGRDRAMAPELVDDQAHFFLHGLVGR